MNQQRRARDALALDSGASRRHTDENGYLHVAASHITKAQVAPYRGCEIPGWEERGLDPDGIYYAYRDPVELEKSLATWNGVPLHTDAGTPAWWFRLLGAKLLKVNPVKDSDSALNYAIQEMSKSGTPLLIGVSDYDGGPFKVLGFYYSNSYDPQEIALVDTNLFRGLSGNELKFVLSCGAVSVICENGQIITIIPLSQEQYDALRGNLKARLDQIKDYPYFYR